MIAPAMRPLLADPRRTAALLDGLANDVGVLATSCTVSRVHDVDMAIIECPALELHVARLVELLEFLRSARASGLAA
jgi:hypothetical protein